MGIDKKNAEALAEFGAEHLLVKLVNLPNTPHDTKPAIDFRERYGDLYPNFPPQKYFLPVFIFQRIWAGENDNEDASGYLTNIFYRNIVVPSTDSPTDPRYHPAIQVDFASGTITVKARTLLDFLALAILAHKDDLAICERRGCSHPYFLKTHTRQRFCSHDCANSVREKKKKQWWDENREKFLEKWKRERKARKVLRNKKSSPRRGK